MTAQLSTDKYLCIYPAYINSKKTLAEGRRIPKSKACENPTYNEIKDVCVAAGLKTIVENKLYPRELYRFDMSARGRVRVELKNEDNEIVNDKFKCKKELLVYLGETIPKLKTRAQKGGGDHQGSSQQSQSSKSKKKKRR